MPQDHTSSNISIPTEPDRLCRDAYHSCVFQSVSLACCEADVGLPKSAAPEQQQVMDHADLGLVWMLGNRLSAHVLEYLDFAT